MKRLSNLLQLNLIVLPITLLNVYQQCTHCGLPPSLRNSCTPAVTDRVLVPEEPLVRQAAAGGRQAGVQAGLVRRQARAVVPHHELPSTAFILRPSQHTDCSLSGSQ